MAVAFKTFLGVDLGGGKGKNTAVARLELVGENVLEVLDVGTTHDKQPWYDESLIEYLGAHAKDAMCAVDAPLTLTACVRCRESVCPGMSVCVDPTIVWFRTEGAELIARTAVADRDRIAAVPANGKLGPSYSTAAPTSKKPPTTPYTQRATEVVLHRQHGIMPRETLGQGMGPAHRARGAPDARPRPLRLSPPREPDRGLPQGDLADALGAEGGAGLQARGRHLGHPRPRPWSRCAAASSSDGAAGWPRRRCSPTTTASTP
jgi:hypothetical protein